jgi:hypothetical protein
MKRIVIVMATLGTLLMVAAIVLFLMLYPANTSGIQAHWSQGTVEVPFASKFLLKGSLFECTVAGVEKEIMSLRATSLVISISELVKSPHLYIENQRGGVDEKKNISSVFIDLDPENPVVAVRVLGIVPKEVQETGSREVPIITLTFYFKDKVVKQVPVAIKVADEKDITIAWLEFQRNLILLLWILSCTGLGVPLTWALHELRKLREEWAKPW